MKNNMPSRGGSSFGGKKILLTLSIVILLAAGCNKTQPTSQNNQPNPPASQPGYFQIKEWGVQFQLPEGLKGLVSSYKKLSTGEEVMYFSTQSLMAMDKSAGGNYCDVQFGPIGAVSRVPDFNRPPYQPYGHYIPKNVKVGNYYYFYTHPQAACSASKEVQNLTLQQINLLQSATPSTIKAIQ